MELKISYETKDGIRSIGFYQTFYRNKDLRDALIDRFFSGELGSGNILLLQERFKEYAQENQISNTQIKKVLEFYLKDTETLDKGLCISMLSIDFDMPFVQFMVNVFHNLVKQYFKSETMDLALFLNAQIEEDFAFIIPKDELSKWVELLGRYQNINLCPPIPYHAYRKKNPYPINRLTNDYNSGLITSELIIHSEYFCYDYDEDDEEMNEGLSEFESMKCDIVSQKSQSIVSLNEVFKKSVFEHELVHSLKE